MSAHQIRQRMLFITVIIAMAVGAFMVLNPLARPGSAMAQDTAKKSDGDKGKEKGGGGPPPALIRVGDVSQQELQPRVTLIGRFRELKRVVVGSGQQGRVVFMPIEEGDEVTGPDPATGAKTILARIDPTFSNIEKAATAARLLEAQAEEAEAKANLELATRDRVFYDELEKTKSAKPREVDNARSAEKAMQAKLERAKAAVLTALQEVERVKEELIRYEVVAPFDGVVVRKWMEHGQWVQKGASVVELISRGKVDAVVDVPERYINSLYKDEDIEMMVDALNITVTGKIQAIVPDGIGAARTFPVKIRLDDLKGKLKPGMSVTAWIPTGEKTATLTVPRDAVLTSSSGSVVWTVVDGKALRIDVDVLYGTGQQYAVKASRRNVGPPLVPGMKVVIEGGERLMFPGQAVVISDTR